MQNGTYSAIKLGPDKRPSNGKLIASAPATEQGKCPSEIMALWVPGEVIIGWSEQHREIRRLSPASLGNVRRKRLRRRLDQKHPLIADQLYAVEISARPDHYYPERQEANT